MATARETLTEHSNRIIGLSGRYSDVTFLKQQIDKHVAFDVFEGDYTGDPCYHLPVEAISSDQGLEDLTNRLNGAIVLSSYEEKARHVLERAYATADYPKQTLETLGEAFEFRSIVRIPYMAFRNTIMLMADQPQEYNADDVLRVGAHGFSFLHNIDLIFPKEDMLLDIIKQLDTASAKYAFAGNKEDAAKILYGAYQMLHWLPLRGNDKNGRIGRMAEELRELGFEGDLRLEDKAPWLKPQVFQGGEPA